MQHPAAPAQGAGGHGERTYALTDPTKSLHSAIEYLTEYGFSLIAVGLFGYIWEWHHSGRDGAIPLSVLMRRTPDPEEIDLIPSGLNELIGANLIHQRRS